MSGLIPGFYKACLNYANTTWGGLGVITGTVKIGATGVKRRVRLCSNSTGALIREIWSADSGAFSFDGLRTNIYYTLTALDYNQVYGDVIAARIGTGATVELVLGATPDVDGVVITTDVNAAVYGLGDFTFNTFYSGLGALSGIAQVNHVPVRVVLNLYEAGGGALLRQMLTNADGSYNFAQLNTIYKYTVTAQDREAVRNDAIVSDIALVDLTWPVFAPNGVSIPDLYSKSAFQWCLLAKKGVQISAPLKINQDYKNAIWGGLGVLSGTVKIGVNPCKRRVRLYEANTGVLIREMWSADDGSYTFLGLRTDYKYTVASTDYSNFYNDVIAANITAII